MREVVFRLEAERPGHLEARAETLPIHISAPTLEELQHPAGGSPCSPLPLSWGCPSKRPELSQARSSWPPMIPPHWRSSMALCLVLRRSRA